ncbi:phospholipid-binding protein, PBP family [Methanothermus fervidus DSM 2088]|uniref:Phospholipid-binding protein, PBP family n=1 Tax=Methanothermus fervidus (strain ATCC 43054 / DSM 2088 / JCM 10308 / V24 S) TaxID=523846 RepID=E3GXM2_METFV|nr:YbhB/YbcL family Raf kinase inhibitor-like protein [Methanothermus fervidus]ADP77054.1 phospholipid-binding protein, PBP family [Methanothermus fervidus DSM 2088]
MKIFSKAFKNGEKIPKKYTCDGQDISPPIKWEDIPENTKTLVLICEDPDAPGKTWVHWVLFNIPPEIEELPEGVENKEKLENGAIHGVNDWGRLGYGGPCPPSGTHRYYFRLYALDTELKLEPGAKKEEVVEAMKDHIIDQAELMGTYSRE